MMQLVFSFTVHIWWLGNTQIWRNLIGLSLYNPLFLVILTSFHISSWSVESTGPLGQILKECNDIFNSIQETTTTTKIFFTQIISLCFIYLFITFIHSLQPTISFFFIHSLTFFSVLIGCLKYDDVIEHESNVLYSCDCNIVACNAILQHKQLRLKKCSIMKY